MSEPKIKYHLLVTANPLSDSKAAITIFKIIKRLDILSGDINVFLPGFSCKNNLIAETEDETRKSIEAIKLNNKRMHEDYHGIDPVYHIYLDNEGDLYFNDADFSNFMLDLEDKSSAFEYLGRTDLVVIPSSKGIILYDQLTAYNIDALSELGNTKLEEFLIKVFKLIQKDSDRESLALINKIADLYHRLFIDRQDNHTNQVVIKLDDELLRYMKWKQSDVVFFISYSSKDVLQAYAFKHLLEDEGEKVWMAPDGIPASFDYAQVIPAALRISSRVVVLLSDNSATSVWVRREIGRAISNNTQLDGIFLDGFSMEDVRRYDHLSFLFENIQIHYRIADFFEDRDKFQTFLKRL